MPHPCPTRASSDLAHKRAAFKFGGNGSSTISAFGVTGKGVAERGFLDDGRPRSEAAGHYGPPRRFHVPRRSRGLRRCACPLGRDQPHARRCSQKRADRKSVVEGKSV